MTATSMNPPVWEQKTIPVIYRRGKGLPLCVRLPYRDDNKAWLREGRQRRPSWNADRKHWEVPVAWFDELIESALARFGKVYVIQIYRERQKCAPACWNAVGHHCECSCMGARHGSGHPDGAWRVVSEASAFQWGPKQYAVRLLSSAA